MPADPVFLTEEAVLLIHDDQLVEFGGAQGLRDPGLLASALAQPAATFGGAYLHRDLHHMAAAYRFHIVRDHPFVDGNKRTGLISALVFLDLNGVVIDRDVPTLYDLTLAVDRRTFGKGSSCGRSASVVPGVGPRCGVRSGGGRSRLTVGRSDSRTVGP